MKYLTYKSNRNLVRVKSFPRYRFYLLVNLFSILLIQLIISVIVWFTNVGSIRIELFTFTNGLLIRASISAFLIVEFTHVITAFDARVLIDGVWGVVAEVDDEELELDPDGVIPLPEDLLCDEKPKTGCSDTSSSRRLNKPVSRLRCVSIWYASFICAHLLRWLRSYLSLDWLNAVDWLLYSAWTTKTQI